VLAVMSEEEKRVIKGDDLAEGIKGVIV